MSLLQINVSIDRYRRIFCAAERLSKDLRIGCKLTKNKKKLQLVDSYINCLEELVKSDCSVYFFQNCLLNKSGFKSIVPCLENAEESVLMYSNFVFGFRAICRHVGKVQVKNSLNLHLFMNKGSSMMIRQFKFRLRGRTFNIFILQRQI